MITYKNCKIFKSKTGKIFRIYLYRNENGKVVRFHGENINLSNNEPKKERIYKEVD